MAIGGALSLGSMMFGGGNDYDPERKALKRFYELTNPNSSFFKQHRSIFARMLSDSSATIDSLTGLSRAGGASLGTANALALGQSAANRSKDTESALDATAKMGLGAEQIAQGYLGLEYKRAQDENDSDNSLINQVLGLGGSLLAGGLLGKGGDGLPVGTEPKVATQWG